MDIIAIKASVCLSNLLRWKKELRVSRFQFRVTEVSSFPLTPDSAQVRRVIKLSGLREETPS